MAEVEYIHVCDYAFQAEGGKACIIGIFSQINAAEFPATHPHMVIAVQLRGQPHEVIPVRIAIERPDGEELLAADGQVSAGADGGAFINFNLLSIQFPEPGRYTVKVLSAERPLATLSFHARRIQQVEPPAVTH